MATEPTKASNPIAAATEKPIAPATPAFVFNKELLQKRLESIKVFQMTYKGKAGFNPYLWLSRNVTPLEQRLNGISTIESKIKPEETKELHDLIMHLPLQCPPETPKPKI